MKDPKSVTLAQVWTRGKDGLYTLEEDRMEELFGDGVRLKNITLEITDEPITWGVVDQYLPEKFYKEIVEKWRSLTRDEKRRLVDLVTFKRGEQK